LVTGVTKKEINRTTHPGPPRETSCSMYQVFRHYQPFISLLLLVIHIYFYSKRKETNSKESTIKIPARPELKAVVADVKEPSDKPPEFPDSPVPYVNDAGKSCGMS
jgi:hypothetical protein